MIHSVLLGAGEWLVWAYGIVPALIHWYNRLLLWLGYLTAQMQAKIDERDALS